MLNLRQVDLHSHSRSFAAEHHLPDSSYHTPDNVKSPSISAPRFRIPQSIVGNLGEELTDGYGESELDDTGSDTGYEQNDSDEVSGSTLAKGSERISMASFSVEEFVTPPRAQSRSRNSASGSGSQEGSQTSYELV